MESCWLHEMLLARRVVHDLYLERHIYADATRAVLAISIG
jgi:hypothetical protein